MKLYFLITVALLHLFFSTVSNAQEGPRGNAPADGIIFGTIIDNKSNEPIEYANVSIYSLRDSTLVSGGISNKKGVFQITSLRYGKYYVDIDFIGYKKIRVNDVFINPENNNVSLGKIKLSPAVEMLNEVEIEAEGPSVEYKIDRKVITVDKNLSAAGGTAVDVLENTPSVQTDIDGNVSIRGNSNFLVLIDGRPSPVQGSDALQQIPAGSIQSIEIITNPSAKYDPDGVGGIINVILKKDKRTGINGLFSLSYGSFNTLGGDFLVNMRTEKFNFFVGGNYNNRLNKSSGNSEQRTYASDTLFVYKESQNNRGREDGKLRGGFDFFITPNDVITLSGNIGKDGMHSGADEYFTSYWLRDNMVSDSISYNNVNSGQHNGLYYSADLNFQHKFLKKGHELTAYTYFDYDDNDENDQYTQYFSATDTNSYRTREFSISRNLRGQIDYTLPLFEKGKLEAGYQVKQKWSSNNYDYQSLIVDDWVDSLTNNYSFDQNIQSGYLTFSHEVGKFGYMLGLRSEYTNRTIHQAAVIVPFDSVYKAFNVFPTLHLSYQLPWEMQVMTSYSRRINRPWDFFLDPYPEVTDAYNIRQGNPMLAPESTNSAELNLQKRFGNNFVSIEGFYRYTTNKFERIKKVSPDNSEIMISTWENIGKDMSLGGELMGNVNLTKWWNLNLSGEAYYYEIVADASGNVNSNNTFTWGARMNNTFKIKKTGTTFQLSGFLRGNSITSQGTTKGSGMVNIALRQDFLDRSLSVTFNLRDIFNTMNHEFISETESFYSYTYMNRKSPTFNITITYKLNDFTKRKDKTSEYGQDEGDEM
ncbi:MAG: TonB-dependent receptor [Bacteroidales bacterium]|nr:TonB-dependent receptor [Bacteroidales bacterium]HOY37945.1 TonB-dependent receptor [Bacteroidales bacterium]